MSTNKDICSGWSVSGIARKIAPWLVGVVAFWALSYLFYAPQYEGKSLGQGDITQYGGMSRDIREHREATGEDPQWTGAMFSGMPAYLIDVSYPEQEVKNSVGQIVKCVASPMNMTLFAMLLMMLSAVLMGVNPWIGIIAGLAYGLSTYFFLIIDAGHITKMWALVYAPPLVASVWYALRRNMWVGAALAALFGSLELGANHPQITYYFLLVCVAFWLNELWFAYRDKSLKGFLSRTMLLACAAALALCSNIAPLWYTMKHQRYTTRANSEVVDAELARQEKIAYNTAWSYGILESGNMLVPDYVGAWSGDYNDDAIAVLQSRGAQEAMFGEAVDDLTELLREQMPELSRRDVEYWLDAGDERLLEEVYYLYQARNNIASKYASNYWGGQPYTAGPTYLGAALILLSLLGAMLTSSRNRWWMVAVSLFALLLAWGANFMGLYEIMYDLLPGYDNFRTVSMALVVVEWSVALMAAMALWELWQTTLDGRVLRRRIMIAAGALIAVIGVMLLVADYGVKGIYDELGDALWVEQLREAALDARRSAALGDALRSTIYILLTAAALMLYVRFKERGGEVWIKGAMLAVAATLAIVDIAGVDRRYMDEEKWFERAPVEVMPTAADRQIMEDKELGYRVMDLSQDPFNSARASYFHRSVGGYHGAKLGRYQELIDRHLKGFTPDVLSALNIRYVIDEGKAVSLEEFIGAEPFGAAWFVEGVRRYATPREELDALAEVELRRYAVVPDKTQLSAESYDATGSINMVEYAPNYLKYEYSATHSSLVVFSEIYFEDGWSAYVDGQPADYFMADYLLRAMELPAGEHIVEWRFRAPAWNTISTIMAIASWLILLSVVVMLVVVACGCKKRCKKESE